MTFDTSIFNSLRRSVSALWALLFIVLLLVAQSFILLSVDELAEKVAGLFSGGSTVLFLKIGQNTMPCSC